MVHSGALGGQGCLDLFFIPRCLLCACPIPCHPPPPVPHLQCPSRYTYVQEYFLSLSPLKSSLF